MIQEEEKTINISLTIDDFLKAHGHSNYALLTQTNPFEQKVYEALKSHVDQILPCVCFKNLEIDLVIRCGNQLGVAEVKSGRKALTKEGIDQLNTACQRDFLGTYTKRFLILDRALGSNNRLLAEAHHINLIEVMDSWQSGLSNKDKSCLVGIVKTALGVRT